jgi:hypothetical protein
MTCWPLLTRNKVEDSKVEEAVSTYVDSEFEELKMLAQNVSFLLSSFPSRSCRARAYRIHSFPTAHPNLVRSRDCLPYSETTSSNRASSTLQIFIQLSQLTRVYLR